jgi:hypothetical protein
MTRDLLGAITIEGLRPFAIEGERANMALTKAVFLSFPQPFFPPPTKK